MALSSGTAGRANDHDPKHLASTAGLVTESGEPLVSGAVWKLEVRAGPGGLRYLTVHRRRQALILTTSPVRRAGAPIE